MRIVTDRGGCHTFLTPVPEGGQDKLVVIPEFLWHTNTKGRGQFLELYYFIQFILVECVICAFCLFLSLARGL